MWTVIFKTASVPASQHILRSPFPSFPPIEQSRCSIPPFERCKATPRSLLEHLVDRSKSHLSSLSRGFGLIFCALLCCSPHCSSDRNLLSTVSLYPYIPSAAVCRLGCPSSSPCAAFICSCEDKRNKSGHPQTLIPFFARVIDSLFAASLPFFFLSLSCRGLGNRTNDVFFSWVLAGVSQSLSRARITRISCFGLPFGVSHCPSPYARAAHSPHKPGCPS